MSTELSSPAPEMGVPPLPPAPPPYAKRVKSPGVALFLSLFPGLGQVYNAQPGKALVFFLLFVGCIYGAAEISPMPFAFGIPFVYLYNLVDAYRSACCINDRGSIPLEQDAAESPAWGATLVAFGLVLLVHNLGWIDLVAFRRYWPLLLIVGGGVLLYNSLKRRGETVDGAGA